MNTLSSVKEIQFVYLDDENFNLYQQEMEAEEQQ